MRILLLQCVPRAWHFMSMLPALWPDIAYMDPLEGEASHTMKNRPRPLEKYNAYKLEWLHDSIHFIVLLVAVFALFRFVIGLSVVGGDSMVPRLLDKDIVVYSRLSRDYRPGDIIAMRVPSGEYYVKRVIATGGDTVEVRNGRIKVNGVEIDDPWGYGETLAERGTVIYPYLVREGNVFVLGDNRRVSMDSRTFGEVNLRQIRGKILLRAGLWYVEPVGNEGSS